MGAMQDVLDFVQPYPHTRPRQRLHRRTQVVEEGLNLAPMNVSACRLAEDGTNQVLVFMAHGVIWRVALRRRRRRRSDPGPPVVRRMPRRDSRRSRGSHTEGLLGPLVLRREIGRHRPKSLQQSADFEPAATTVRQPAGPVSLASRRRTLETGEAYRHAYL